ncbi:MAG: hypothetical protein WAW78_14485, partial [Propioniciclava sp.]
TRVRFRWCAERPAARPASEGPAPDSPTCPTSTRPQPDARAPSPRPPGPLPTPVTCYHLFHSPVRAVVVGEPADTQVKWPRMATP